jgi:hypothetical protein
MSETDKKDDEEKPLSSALLSLLPPQPVVPTVLMDDDEVEATEFLYSDRAPTDWVVSGPLGESGFGKGRDFPTWEAAEEWAKDFYGWRFRGRKPDEPGSHGRWAFVIKGPRGEHVRSS